MSVLRELERARCERDLAVDALRLYRYALATAANIINAIVADGDLVPGAIEEAARVQIERAAKAAEAILRSLEE